MGTISELQIGKAGEYLVCADLILRGHIAFPSEQGLPFDVVFQHGGKLLKVQVKATLIPKINPMYPGGVPVYKVGFQNGKGNKRSRYESEQVDIFAIVALDTKKIAYLPHRKVVSGMCFRVPEFRGSYHDEKATKNKARVLELRSKGLSCETIADELKLGLKNVYKYSANVSIAQKGGNAGKYMDDLTLENCLNDLGLI